LIAHIKDVSTFSKDAFLSSPAATSPSARMETQLAVLLRQDNFRVNRIKVNQFNHLITTAEGEVQMSTYFFETDSAYFTFITNFPMAKPKTKRLKISSYYWAALKRPVDFRRRQLQFLLTLGAVRATILT
jgi:hypothetical protein